MKKRALVNKPIIYLFVELSHPPKKKTIYYDKQIAKKTWIQPGRSRKNDFKTITFFMVVHQSLDQCVAVPTCSAF